jgi:hypothetical protein
VSLYVEILIRAPLEAIWAFTQAPDRHERWDLRFSRIEYLPRASQAEPQRFRYATRVGFGLEIAGDGETVGARDLPDGSRSSALVFASDDPRSLIRRGSGYWKYVPTADGVRFLTRYDYGTRFGAFGACVDRLIFRPLMGWATAWSFDRLRLWLERGVEPAQALRQAVAHAFARTALAFVFAWHGAVPKLLGPHADEVAILADAGVTGDAARGLLVALGLGELAFAAVLLGAWHRRWPLWVCLAAMAAATVSVVLLSPRYAGAAFNPISLNLAVAALAAVDLLTLADVPSAARCRRRAPEEAA